MTRIAHVEMIDRVLAPAETELWVAVHTTEPMPDAQVVGKLTGPRCLYSETIEIAYKLRPLPAHHAGEQADTPTARVIIPEASFWEPVCPFLYGGTVELQHQGRLVESVRVRHGLRQIRITDRVLLNGHPLTLRGHSCSALTEPEASTLHTAGCNLLSVPVEVRTESVWSLADEVGFLMLGHIQTWDDSIEAMLRVRQRQPSCLGWLVSASAGIVADVLACSTKPVGLLLDGPREVIPDGIAFVVADEPSRRGELPWLLLSDDNDASFPEGAIGTLSMR